MRNPKRIYFIIQKLDEAWEFVPDWRLAQLISNLLGPGLHDIFHLEDDHLEELLDKFIEEHKKEIDENL